MRNCFRVCAYWAVEAVEGFNVFKSSKTAVVISEENKTDEGEDNLSTEKRKINLKLEVCF